MAIQPVPFDIPEDGLGDQVAWALSLTEPSAHERRRLGHARQIDDDDLLRSSYGTSPSASSSSACDTVPRGATMNRSSIVNTSARRNHGERTSESPPAMNERSSSGYFSCRRGKRSTV